MESQLYSLLQKLILTNEMRIDNEELKLQLMSHPSYPSLHAVTGVLDHFGIPNAALRVPVTNQVLEQTPANFIATLNINTNESLVLVERTAKSIRVIDQDKKKKVFNKTEFLERWTGIILAIEPDEHNYKAIRLRASFISTSLLILLAVAGIGLFCYLNPYVILIAHFSLSVSGLILSYFIVKHELGIQSGTINHFCNLSEHTSCHAVLQSKGATLFGIFKLSDAGIVVFTSLPLTWMMLSIAHISAASLFGLISLVSLPVVCYSIYYQAKIIKKWCPLCLGVATVLMLQFAVLMVGNTITDIKFTFSAILIFTVIIAAVSASWDITKRLLIQKTTLRELKITHNKFKRNFSLFHALLKKESVVKDNLPIPGELVFGATNAAVKLTLVTSPFCGFCKKAHSDIGEILNKASDKVAVTIRFLASTDNKEDDLYRLTTELLRVYNRQGSSSALNALHEVYAADVAVADLKQWLQQRPDSPDTNYDAILKAQRGWAINNNINFTPALLVNDRAFPKEYDRTDLLYFLDDLIETTQTRADSSPRQLQPAVAS